MSKRADRTKLGKAPQPARCGNVYAAATKNQLAASGVPRTTDEAFSKSQPRWSFKSPDYLTPNQAAAEIGLTGEAVKQWIYKDRLPAEKMHNGYWRIRRDDLTAFLQERINPAARVVMIADEDAEFTASAEKQLVQAGVQVQVQVCANPVDALLKAQRRAPALLVLALDNENAWTVAEEIRNLRYTKNIPILFTSTTALSQDSMQMMLRIRGQGYLRKQVDPDSLVKETQRTLSGIP